VTHPNNPDVITTIAFYDKRTHKIKSSIDLAYNKSGEYIPYSTEIVKGREKIFGTHYHKWPAGEKGKSGRTRHDTGNSYAPTEKEMRYIKFVALPSIALPAQHLAILGNVLKGI